MNYKIGVISGDGIGPEIVREARKVLDAVCKKYGHEFDYTDLLLGGASIDVHGVPLTEETIEQAKKCDAVLMGPLVVMQRLLHGTAGAVQTLRRQDCWEQKGFEPVCKSETGLSL